MRTSHSTIQDYKRCKRLYWLKHVEGLRAVESSAALERGKSYHEKIEQLLNTGDFDRDDNLKTNAMASAFKKYIYPTILESSNIDSVESWFSYKTASGHEVVGRIDGKTASGEVIEHKTTSYAIDEQYKFLLSIDEQIPTYMHAHLTNKVRYTVCQTPTIRQKKNESDEEFENRCIEWYAEDTESKIATFEIQFPVEKIENFIAEQDKVITEMENCDLFYRNTSYCKNWGGLCEYAPICENYDPKQEYIGFTRYEKT